MQENKKGDKEKAISNTRAYLIIFALIPVVVLTTIVPHIWIWGRGEPNLATWSFLIIFVLSTIAHELLHGVGFWYFGKASWKDIHFGLNWKVLAAYAASTAVMSVRAYRATVLLPALVLGVIPAVIGLSSGIGWLTGYGAVMLGVAGGDVAALWAVRSLLGSDVVKTHPDKLGCIVLSSPPPSSGVAGASG